MIIKECSEYAQGCDGGFPYLIGGKYAEVNISVSIIFYFKRFDYNFHLRLQLGFWLGGRILQSIQR